MVALVLYTIIAIGLASAAGYAVLTFVQASSTSTTAFENVARLDMAEAMLRASLKADDDGNLIAPMGDPSGVEARDYTGLPSDIGAPMETPWGVPFLYCPYHPNMRGGSGTVTGGVDDDDNYAVEVDADGYVISSAAPPVDHLLAAIVSPTLNNDQLPDCDQIGFINGRFVINGEEDHPGGIVRGISTAVQRAESLAAASGMAQIYAAATPPEGGDGAAPGNETSLDNAVRTWRGLHPRLTTIDVSQCDPGCSLDDSALNDGGDARAAGAVLLLEGGGAGVVTLTDTAGGEAEISGTMRISGASVTGAALNLQPGATLIVEAGATVGTVNATDATLRIAGTAGAITLTGGELILRGTSAQAASIVATDTDVVVSDSASVTGTVAVTGGALSVRSSTTGAITATASDVIVAGELTVTGGPANAITLRDGATLTLDGATISGGTAAQVVDDGAGGLYGTGTLTAGSGVCGTGDLFTGWTGGVFGARDVTPDLVFDVDFGTDDPGTLTVDETELADAAETLASLESLETLSNARRDEARYWAARANWTCNP